jgi:P27 family predicted phage terminase small subunit
MEGTVMAGARRGPAAKNAAQREYEGSRRKRSAAKSPALEAIATPGPPNDLPASAREFWLRYAPILSSAQVLTAADLAAFEASSRAWGRYLDLARRLADGSIPETLETAKGGEYLNPIIHLMRTHEKAAIEWLQEFGLTPASRPRVKAVAPAKQATIQERLGLVG